MTFLRSLLLKSEKIEDISIYPYCIPALQHLEMFNLENPVTFLVGENGCGKSTLIEAIAILAGFNPEGGSKNFNYSYQKTESHYFHAIKLVRNFKKERTGFFLRAETMFNISTHVLEQGLSEYGWENLHQMSHGEAFLWLMQNRFGENGLYILDEPEAALSPQRQLALLRIIHDLVQNGSQFIIATHSPILMAYPKAALFELDEKGIQPIKLEDTQHFLVTRDFLNNPKNFLRVLLTDPEN